MLARARARSNEQPTREHTKTEKVTSNNIFFFTTATTPPPPLFFSSVPKSSSSYECVRVSAHGARKRSASHHAMRLWFEVTKEQESKRLKNLPRRRTYSRPVRRHGGCVTANSTTGGKHTFCTYIHTYILRACVRSLAFN